MHSYMPRYMLYECRSKVLAEEDDMDEHAHLLDNIKNKVIYPAMTRARCPGRVINSENVKYYAA